MFLFTKRPYGAVLTHAILAPISLEHTIWLELRRLPQILVLFRSVRWVVVEQEAAWATPQWSDEPRQKCSR